MAAPFVPATSAPAPAPTATGACACSVPNYQTTDSLSLAAQLILTGNCPYDSAQGGCPSDQTFGFGNAGVSLVSSSGQLPPFVRGQCCCRSAACQAWSAASSCLCSSCCGLCRGATLVKSLPEHIELYLYPCVLQAAASRLAAATLALTTSAPATLAQATAATTARVSFVPFTWLVGWGCLPVVAVCEACPQNPCFMYCIG